MHYPNGRVYISKDLSANCKTFAMVVNVSKMTFGGQTGRAGALRPVVSAIERLQHARLLIVQSVMKNAPGPDEERSTGAYCRPGYKPRSNFRSCSLTSSSDICIWACD